ncbi:PREDICTED: WD repeat-containing protein 27 isoform X2 [Gavialis gangeticus]|uniref:WD repeat-containing protein 27 isoform X2 n=1 Tax=Gavialis gangeticus TaxID=94835 RepID=UPI00092F7664|nr:PREDICTED: WD repeat-containing protein 27 isoform X2 [Gavialis gangeticus]
MESPMDRCFAEEGNSLDIVLEKQVFRSKVLESHVQLACSSQYCAFPLNGNELCICNIGINPVHQPLHLIGHHHSITAVSFGNKMNPLLVCSASRDYVIVWNLDECTKKALQGITPCGIVIGTLLGIVLYVRFSPDDQTVAVCAGNQIYILNAKNEAVLAELEGHLAPVTAAEFCTWEKNMLISVSEDRSFKVWNCCTGVLMYQSAVLTAFPLLSLFIDEEKKQIITGCADGQLWIFSLISGHNYRCVVHINLKKEIKRFYSKTGKSLQQLGEIQNNFKLSGLNDMRVEETVETSLRILRIEHCDQPTHTDKEENFSPAVNARYLWIGSSTGLFIINLANFEIEAALHYKDYSDLSIQFAGSCALTRKAVDGKVLCLLTSTFENVIALLEISPTALMRAQKNEFLLYGKEKCLLVIASCSLLPNSPLNTQSLKKSSSKLTNKKTLGTKGTMKDQPLVFHNKIKSSGYTSAPQMIMFSPNTKMKKTNKVLEWKSSCKRKNKEYPLENFPPTKSERQISVAGKPTSISCIQYSGDGEQLACGLADKSLLVFNSNLTGTPSVFSGHDGAINSVGWSHNKKWLVSASEDRTVRIWSVCNTEPVLLLGSAFSTQQPEAYNLFMTTAIGDGIKLWDLRTLRCERRFEGHINRCHPCGIAVSPCGRFIASGSEDKCAYVYEMHSSTFSHKLTGHTESVINVAFNPASAQLTTATLDGKLQLFLP